VSVGHVVAAIPAATVLYASDVFAAVVLPELVRAAACALAGARERSVRQAASGALLRLLRGAHGEELLCRCARRHIVVVHRHTTIPFATLDLPHRRP
jgi:hypothetical protein